MFVDLVAFLQPTAERAVDECPARLAVAGIVEAYAGAPMRLRPAIEGLSLGPFHIGLEPAKPKQAGGSALAVAHGNVALGRRPDRQENWSAVGHCLRQPRHSGPSRGSPRCHGFAANNAEALTAGP